MCSRGWPCWALIEEAALGPAQCRGMWGGGGGGKGVDGEGNTLIEEGEGNGIGASVQETGKGNNI